MRNTIILLAIFYYASLIPTNAQNNFKETYKKAYAFTTTNQDSALVWAKKSVLLANNPQQKYSAYYMLAFNANRLNLNGLSLEGYKKAAHFAIDSSKKYKSLNSLASTYWQMGDYHKAQKINHICLIFFEKQRQYESLSYALELKGMILQKQKDSTTFKILHRALQIRKKFAKKDIGYTHHNLAMCFAAFNRYDSAAIYQRKAVNNYPLKSSDRQAKQQILLAKYLIFSNNHSEALTYLQNTKHVEKKPLTALLWCHTFQLYHIKLNNQESFVKPCNDLLQQILLSAKDLASRKYINEQVIEMYRHILHMKTLKSTMHQKYLNLIDSVQNKIERYNQKLAHKDKLHLEELIKALNAKSQKPFIPWYYWLILLAMIGSLLSFWIWRKTHQTPPETPSPEMEALVKERQLIQALEEKTGISLEVATREMVLLCYRGRSFTQIARDMGVTRDTVKGRFRSLAKKAQIESIKKFVQEFGQDIEK